ncbi:ABC transporter transmembrane domain-containing protein [Limibaculum sp. FT325]|uniref:ABC transporter transmembrane domain-containing protein n=1 Tax=Thermohalobaculum sediminis TaxID=2939436 RepID=UPI0020BE9C5F|nr:ABC transporter transmembrane domain-containing protein [Limibaculum sediminis]MCL5777927.1 ABC transporter transmembrane domain-containing protein [Limibaculum sediminis]
MEKSFFWFVWRFSKREQIFILALTVASFPLVYLSLELPKMIVNDAISGRDFPREILGLEFGQIPYLLLLCAAFLGMVVLINGVKWVMNIAIGMTGERMLRRLRFQLIEQVMRYPMSRMRSTKPGEVVQALMGEIEPLGGFIGEVIATPAFQGGLLCVYVFFIFMQDPLLGLAAISLYPVQAWLIPWMQAKVVRLNKERAANNRTLADTLSESVGQMPEIQTNDTARWHMAQVAGKLYQNTLIRMQIFRRKFTIKFVNNFLNQLTPFFFYSIGGYLVIEGELDFGALVAVLAAYKDLAGPWKEVLAYVQRWSDFNGRYGYVVDNFMGDDVGPPARVWDVTGRGRPLAGDLALDHIDGGPGTGGLHASGITLPRGASVAVVGGEHGAREALLRMISGLMLPHAGNVRIGGQALADATLPQIGRSLAFVGAEPGLVNRSMRDNLLYGLFACAPEPPGAAEAQMMRREARATGNIEADPEGDWVDYDAAGVPDAAALEARLIDLTETFGLGTELYSGALEARIPPAEAAEWTAPVLAARARLATSGAGAELSDLLEPWDRAAFNRNASVFENLLFALPIDAWGDSADLMRRADVAELLARTGGMAELEGLGWRIASEFAELIEAVTPDSTVLDGFPGYSRAEVLAAGELFARHRGDPPGKLPATARQTLAVLAARFVPQRDRLDVIDDETRARVLACRARVLDTLGDRQDVVRFDEARFSPALSVSQNIIGAKRRFDRKARWRQLDVALEEATRAAGLRDALMRLGLDAPVGSGGSGLTANARRRVGLIRAVIKRPRLVILDGVAGSASAADAELRAAMRAELPDATLVWAADSEAAAADADRILAVADDGGVRLFEPAGERDAVQPGSITGGGVPVAPPDGDDASSEATRPIDRRAGE